jgi:peptidoglycan/LPS O-acetylase OafA/YrhL
MSLMRIDDVNFSAVAPGDIVEYDVSDVTRQLRYVRFAEYSLIWYGLRIPMILVIFFSLNSDDWPIRTIVFLTCCLFGGICVASYRSAGPEAENLALVPIASSACLRYCFAIVLAG